MYRTRDMSEEIRKSREVMAKAFKEDDYFRFTYLANIAMCVYDYSKVTMSIQQCNQVAEDLVRFIFERDH